MCGRNWWRSSIWKAETICRLWQVMHMAKKLGWCATLSSGGREELVIVQVHGSFSTFEQSVLDGGIVVLVTEGLLMMLTLRKSVGTTWTANLMPSFVIFSQYKGFQLHRTTSSESLAFSSPCSNMLQCSDCFQSGEGGMAGCRVAL